MTFSIAINYFGEHHLARLRESFSELNCEHYFFCREAPALPSGDTTIVGGYGIEFGKTIRQPIHRQLACDDSAFLMIVGDNLHRLLPKTLDHNSSCVLHSGYTVL